MTETAPIAGSYESVGFRQLDKPLLHIKSTVLLSLRRLAVDGLHNLLKASSSMARRSRDANRLTSLHISIRTCTTSRRRNVHGCNKIALMQQ